MFQNKKAPAVGSTSARRNNQNQKVGVVVGRNEKLSTPTTGKVRSTSVKVGSNTQAPIAQQLEIESKLSNNHSEEMYVKIQEYESLVGQLKALIEAKDNEIEEIKGRLQESRRSREATLDDVKVNRAKYKAVITVLEKRIADSLDKVIRFEKDHENEEEYSIQVQRLKAQLGQTIKMNDNLKLSLQLSKNETAEKESRMKDLLTLVSKLEKNIGDAEVDKQDLVEKAEDCLTKAKNSENIDTSVITILQEQLAQSQAKLDTVKEELLMERQKNKELVDSFAESKREYGLSKVDLRIATKENRDLTEKISRKTEELNTMAKECQETKDANVTLERRVGELEKTIAGDDIKLQEAGNEVKQSQKMLEAVKAETESLETQNKCLQNEIRQLIDQLKALERVHETLKHRDVTIQEQAAKLEERDKKIESLQKNIVVLREASVVLDNQLKEFETGFTRNLQEIEQLQSSNAHLTDECSALKEDLKKGVRDEASECSSLKEALQKTRIDLNQALSLKTFVEKSLEDLKSALERKDEQMSTSLASFSSKVEELKGRNSDLVSCCNKLASKIGDVEREKDKVEKQSESLLLDNSKLTKEVQIYVDAVYKLKHDNITLTETVDQALIKAESHKAELDKLSGEHKAVILEKDESTLQMQSTINQQLKLIEFLRDQNEALIKKKGKKFHLFGGGDKESKDTTPVKKGITLPRTNATPVDTPDRKRTYQSALTLGKCEDDKELEELLEEINMNRGKEDSPLSVDRNEAERETLKGYKIRKSVIYIDEKERLDINCVFHVPEDWYLMGCDEGLFSVKIGTGLASDASISSSKVKIEGIQAVYQMEFIFSLNSVLFIEGIDRKLVMAGMGLIRTCAEAAECSHPKLNTATVSDIQNCHMFQIQDIDRGHLTVAVSTAKHLNILSWNGSSFALLKRLSMTEPITCMLMTSDSVIFGSDKIYELDSKNFQLDEFLDDSDETLYYLRYSSGVSAVRATFPVAIVDVGMSNWAPEKTSYTKEYLMCYPDMGVFVDEFGRRTRPEDVVWSKLPVSILYRHPNLFVVHFSSVEVIRLNADSYTRSRTPSDNGDGEEDQSNVPISSFMQLSNPRILGAGRKTASVVISSLDKHKTEMYEVDLDGPLHDALDD